MLKPIVSKLEASTPSGPLLAAPFKPSRWNACAATTLNSAQPSSINRCWTSITHFFSNLLQSIIRCFQRVFCCCKAKVEPVQDKVKPPIQEKAKPPIQKKEIDPLPESVKSAVWLFAKSEVLSHYLEEAKSKGEVFDKEALTQEILKYCQTYQEDILKQFLDKLIQGLQEERRLYIGKNDSFANPEFYLWVANNFPEIESIDLDNTEISNESLRVLIPRCPNLKKISMNEIQGFSPKELVDSLSSSSQLRDAYFYEGIPLSDECVQTLARYCPLLKSLCFYGSSSLTAQGVQALAQNCTKLETLGIRGNQVSPNALIAVGQCTQVRSLDLLEVRQLNREVMKELGQKCLHLKNLSLFNTEISDEELIQFFSYGGKKIEELCLGYTKITADGLKFALKQGRAITSITQVYRIDLTPLGLTENPTRETSRKISINYEDRFYDEPNY